MQGLKAFHAEVTEGKAWTTEDDEYNLWITHRETVGSHRFQLEASLFLILYHHHRAQTPHHAMLAGFDSPPTQPV